ncbi:hypothetical protein CSUI_000282, partial [Cystoisospora suis]
MCKHAKEKRWSVAYIELLPGGVPATLSRCGYSQSQPQGAAGKQSDTNAFPRCRRRGGTQLRPTPRMCFCVVPGGNRYNRHPSGGRLTCGAVPPGAAVLQNVQVAQAVTWPEERTQGNEA